MIGIFSIQAPALAAALIAGAGTERFTFREIHMACDTRVTVYAPDEPRAAAAARRAFDRINITQMLFAVSFSIFTILPITG